MTDVDSSPSDVRRNRAAVVGLVFGLVGAIGSLIPLLFVLTWLIGMPIPVDQFAAYDVSVVIVCVGIPLALAGIVVSVVALRRSKLRGRRSSAVAGLVLNAVAIVVCGLAVGGYDWLIDTVIQSVNNLAP